MGQMFKDQNACPMCVCELDDPMTDLVGRFFIDGTYLGPPCGIVLFTCSDDTRFSSVAGDPSQPSLPKAVYLFAPAYEAGRNDRAFARLHGTDRQTLRDIQFDCSYFHVRKP